MSRPDKKRYIIAASKSWNIEAARSFIADSPDLQIKLITDKKALTYGEIKNFNPRYVFFLHWSWLIPQAIHRNYDCVVFHMTDLPFGRGGSPLQNLIERGIYKTKIAAIKAVRELDAGDILLKKSLTLEGSADEIFRRATKIIFTSMIPRIIKDEPVPVPQKGKVVRFKRRLPEQGTIARLSSLTKVYDYIRMLDAEGYPPAFMEVSGLRLEFFDAQKKKDYITAKVRLRIKDET
ncbi:MAG: methionyl-tRNA formyltransferase [Candidatus Omnitrophica bacterium]|nr:methionyl-tRNA formyltransferase [Candidatus Omnitrophota bacterium]